MNLEEFKTPGKEYRPSPFWSWNNRLDTDELRWQVREFADKGFGGYFMHSRVGLATPYLSEEWMRRIGACLEEGKKAEVESWIYDEDKWPSGFAGGIVPAKSEEYRSRTVVMKELKHGEADSGLKDPSVLAVFEIEFSSASTMRTLKHISKSSDIEGYGRLFTFKVEVALRSNWYNGESYVDLLNPEATEEFLKVTIDAYAKRFKEGFGEYMPGVFTDEPNYYNPVPATRLAIPWTGEMAEYFFKRNGYGLIEKIALLYFEGEGYQKVRYDFWRTVTQRFIEAWTIPYSERCERYGLKMTGHYLCEDNLPIQIRYIGAAMPHYEHMHVPGIDHLGRNINDPLTLKQCSSVAHQFGRRRILCEIFGCSGHSMTFEDQKWIADFHFALGITFLCQHLTLYTQKGEAKRDYPPTISYHQTYWPHYKLINDYFSRAGYLCSQGRFYADILVLHPIGSAWATYSPGAIDDRESQSWKYNEALVRLQDGLLATHWDFDLGDEVILARHAHIKDKESFIVKEASYKLIVVPPSLTWSRKTVNLLARFSEVGGRVLFVGETPTMIEGEPAEEEWRKILAHPQASHSAEDKRAVDNAISKVSSRSVSVRDEDGNEIGDIYIHHRVDGENHIHFLSNRSRTESYNTIIAFTEKGQVNELDLFHGSTSRVEAVTHQGKTVISAVFYPAGSHAYIIDTSKSGAPEGPIPKIKTKLDELVLKLPNVWSFERLHPNSMVLDTFQYSIEGEEWSKEKPVWKVRREVSKAAGLEAYTGIQPWVLIEKGVEPSKPFVLRLRTSFKSEVKGRKVYLVIEKAPIWSLHINGKPVSTDTEAWHWDKQFNKIEVTDHVKIGENLIELSCRYGMDVPIEDIYVVGDFAVRKISETVYALTDEPKTLRDGDWVEQGYPFYTGTMRYLTRFNVEAKPGRSVRLRLPEAKGSLFLAYVNGSGPMPICWHPLKADITRFVKDGENDLAIEVISTLRNTFGPLHHKLGDALTFVGPNTFVDEENWVDAYQFAPYGLINGAEIVVRKVAE